MKIKSKKSKLSEEQKKLEQMISENPKLKTLIKKLDLVLIKTAQ